MNYEKIYHNIINNRLNNPIINEYTECHHILPKSLGGSEDKSNLVNLLAREHFICHLLLTKMYKEGTLEWIKMIKAFMRMQSGRDYQQRYSDNKWYEYLKTNYSKAQSINQSGKGNSQYGKVWISNTLLKETKSIKKEELQEYLNNGWIKKRIIKWDGYMINEDGTLESNYYRKPFEQERHFNLLKRKEDYINNVILYYDIFKKYGFKKMCELTGYNKSYDTFYKSIRRHIYKNLTTKRKKK